MNKLIFTLLLLSTVSAINPLYNEHRSVDEIYNDIINQQECEISPSGVVECGLSDYVKENKIQDILDDVNNIVNNITKLGEIINEKIHFNLNINGVNFNEIIEDEDYFNTFMTKLLLSQHLHFNIKLQAH